METFKTKVPIGTLIVAMANSSKQNNPSVLFLTTPSATSEDNERKYLDCIRVNGKHKSSKGLYILEIIGYGKEYGQLVYDCKVKLKIPYPKDELEEATAFASHREDMKKDISKFTKNWINLNVIVLSELFRQSTIGYSELNCTCVFSLNPDVYIENNGYTTYSFKGNPDNLIRNILTTKSLSHLNYEEVEHFPMTRAEFKKQQKQEAAEKAEAERVAAEEAKKSWTLDDWKAALAAKYNKH